MRMYLFFFRTIKKQRAENCRCGEDIKRKTENFDLLVLKIFVFPYSRIFLLNLIEIHKHRTKGENLRKFLTIKKEEAKKEQK